MNMTEPNQFATASSLRGRLLADEPMARHVSWRAGGAARCAYVPADTADLQAFLADKVAKWQVPDDVVFVDAIPLGATGKMQKNKLREQFKGHRLPGA